MSLLATRSRRDTPWSVGAFSDTTIAVPVHLAARTFQKVFEILRESGLRPNDHKCRIIIQDTVPTELIDDHFPDQLKPIIYTHGKILGVPIGSMEVVSEFLDGVRDKLCGMIETISKLPAHTGFYLLKYCAHPTPIHAIRTNNTSPVYCRDLDREINHGLARLCGREVLNNASIAIRSQPNRNGGLGLTEYNGAFSAIQFEELQHRTALWIDTLGSPALQRTFADQCMRFPAHLLGFDDDDPPDRSPANRRMQRIQDNLCAQFLQELVMNGEDISNRMLLMHLRSASFRGSGDVFTMSWTRDGIPNDIFRQALSHRLFMPILSAEPNAVFGCACGAAGFNSVTCSMHAGACRIARGHAIERHDRVVDAVAAFVQEIDPQAIITRPAQPQENPNPDVPRNVVEDLTITSRGSIQRFDVGITHAVLSNNTPTAGHIQHYNPDTS
jgi:hypothetical protein